MFEFAEITKDMTAAETLNYYRNLYYAEPQVTERGIVANAINDYFNEAAPRAEVIEEYLKKVYAKMGKHTIFRREYIQRIMREVEKEMNGGEQYAKKP